ncbi:unnamed protein product [Chironomus riparius]|uniref:Uncharacterized protein n=1 Tax=Chironomus riparius TaxID=315576 RepID=A0A9N9RYD7_9DIPT|nr:unnamed protein product [Chironomus riparius]
MMYRWTFYLLLIIMTICDVDAIDINCDFKDEIYFGIPVQYSCIVENSLNITNKCFEIKSIQGPHEDNKNISSVTGLSIIEKKIQYIPSNLGEKFNNLIAIRIKGGKLKEIHKSDLKQFVKIKYLNLDRNDIKALEEGLFEFNPELILVWFENNNIKSIGETTFKNLNKLKDLDLNGNHCFSQRFESHMVINLTLIKEACYIATEKDIQLKLFESQLETLRNKLKQNQNEFLNNITTNQKTILTLQSEQQTSQRELQTFKKKYENKLQASETLQVELTHKIEINIAKISKLQVKLQASEKHQEELQEMLNNSTAIISRFNELEIKDKTLIEFLKKFLSNHFWPLAIGFTLVSILSIVNIILVFKLP